MKANLGKYLEPASNGNGNYSISNPISRIPGGLGQPPITRAWTDNGNAKPRTKIAGPHTGIIKIRQVDVDEERGLIFATIKNNFEAYNWADARPSPWDPDRTGFIGVWSIDDDGDVPPRGVIKGPATGLVWPAGVAINPKNHEIYAIDSVSNALFMFKVPEFFVKLPTTTVGR